MGNTQQKLNQNPEKTPVEEEEEEEEEDSIFTCEICIEPIESSSTKKFKNENKCAHPFCTDCIIKYIHVKISDENIADVKCPASNCKHSLDAISCRPIIPPELFVKWCDLLCDKAILGLDRSYCPDRNCSALVVNECGGNLKRSKCPNCKRLFCFRCKLRWHAGYRCEEAREMRDMNDVAFGVLVERKNWMRCPQCSHFVELVEGCSIVKCRCGISFCYKCGRKVIDHWCRCDGRSPLLTACFAVTCTVVVLIASLYVFITIYKLKTRT